MVKLTKENLDQHIKLEDNYEQAKLEYWISKLPHWIVDEDQDLEDENTGG